MSKFLEVLERHDPSNEKNINALMKVQMFLHEKNIPFSCKGRRIILNIDDMEIALEAMTPHSVNPDKLADDVIDSYDQMPLYKKAFNPKKRTLKQTKEKGDKEIVPKLTNYLKKRNDETVRAIDQASKNLKNVASR